MVRNHPISVPPLIEQKRLVKILDEKFQAIDELKKITQEQLESSKELFESRLNGIFVDLRKSADIKKFGEVCDFVRGPFGGSLKKSFFKKDGFAVYEQRHAIYNQFDNIRYYIDEKKFKEMSRFELVAGDLIMSCSGTMGKVAIVPEGVKKGVINQALLKLTPNKGLLSCNYLKMWMESQDFQKSLSELTVGAAIKNVASVKILKEISLPLPDLKMQDVVIKEIYELSEATKELESIFHKKITDLEELKKSYLCEAFSGNL
jgi:type I restriction enzyme S subunit